ncbi:hypothetical protein V6N13_027121 [Hibiscus sabdariffa]|uniref:Uncharacterized protein n=2 Tax=Hibiscus sabdariffa TaxID=183260 RepID=A0ABR1ZNL2_9ROSI
MDCRCVTTFLSNWKAFVRTSGLIGGFDPNTALAMVITPAFWLLSPANATAAVFPRLYWKWIKPIGKTKTSPGYRIFVMRRFSGLDVTKPT